MRRAVPIRTGSRGIEPRLADGPMRALLQRVTQAAVTVDGAEVGRIGPGRCVLLGVATGRFGAHMLVTLVNDGPATFALDLTQMRRVT